jgi:thiosulfate/3-mercaptopyruvate sulfurtransferase
MRTKEASIKGNDMSISRAFGVALLMAVILATTISGVNAECSACKGGSATAQQDLLNKEWAAFLNSDNATTEMSSSSTATGLISPQYSRKNNPSLQEKNSSEQEDSYTSQEKETFTQEKRSDLFSSILVPLDRVGDFKIILDISPSPTECIPGAISLPYTDFLLSGGALKTVSEMSDVLGKAGISEADSVLIYGECQPCGGGPSAATYVYWIMKYLGHKNVKLLDGGIDDWVAQGKPTASVPSVLPSQNYTPALNANLLAAYEYVSSGIPQIVDARTAVEFEAGSIPGSINIPYDRVLDGKKLKDKDALKELFSSINPNDPVVVYTNTGVKASMIWLALTLLGYDARIYSWKDWQANLPHLNIDILEARGYPNPANIGEPVSITVVFKEKTASSDSPPKGDNQSKNDPILTAKGCATCGFGSAQGFADLNSSGGMVKIGSSSQAKRSAAGNGFAASAIVRSSSGKQISKVLLKRIRSDADEFAGIWNANVASGVYSVDIVASLDDLTETFSNALQIEVKGTSKYKNIENE